LRHASLLVCGLVFALAVFGGAAPVSAEAATVRFQGQEAAAFLLFVQPGATEGALVITEVAVIALSGKVQVSGGAPGSGAIALVLVTQAEVIGLTSTLLFLFIGILEITPVTFDTSFPEVPTSASLSGVVPGFDLVSGAPTAVTLAATWSGSGTPVHVNAMSRVTTDGIVVLTRANGFVRPIVTVLASVTGTPVPIAGPLFPGFLGGTFLGSFNSGSVAVF